MSRWVLDHTVAPQNLRSSVAAANQICQGDCLCSSPDHCRSCSHGGSWFKPSNLGNTLKYYYDLATRVLATVFCVIPSNIEILIPYVPQCKELSVIKTRGGRDRTVGGRPSGKMASPFGVIPARTRITMNIPAAGTQARGTTFSISLNVASYIRREAGRCDITFLRKTQCHSQRDRQYTFLGKMPSYYLGSIFETQ